MTSKLIKMIAGCTLWLFLLTICTYAHSGKTDYAGGHYDHSTGEYHYHHGYSAHSHYDIDGDGTIDCPFKFHDNTNHNNSSNNSNSNQNSTSNSNSTQNATNNSNKTQISTNVQANNEKKLTVDDILSSLWLIVAFSVLVIGTGFCFCFPFIEMLIMIPIGALVKKYCSEDSKESILKKCGTVIYIVMVVISVIIVTISVLNLTGII